MIEPASAANLNVSTAIQRASAATGADFSYLMRTAMRESSLDPGAKAPTSSAAGLFQFIEQTWLGMIKQHGKTYGLDRYADAISQSSSGRYTVADRQIRRDILALRFDPQMASIMAGELTRESQDALTRALGRPPSQPELYAAHFMGAEGALDLIRSAQRGDRNAALEFPDEARANRSIFYDRSGRARSSAEVLAQLGSKHGADVGSLMAHAGGAAKAGLRPAYETDDLSGAGVLAFASAGDINNLAFGDASYSLGPQAAIVTPVMAQLLASLNPIPDATSTVIFERERNEERSLRRTLDDRV